MTEPLLQIVGPADGWILEKLARKLAAKLPYAEFVPVRPEPRASTRIVYYVNYALYRGPSGLIDTGFFTHLDTDHSFVERARQMDLCVSMSRLYAEWLKAHGLQSVIHIPMGFDSYRYRPRLVLGVVGLLDHPRKGKHLVEQIRRLPFVEVMTTEGRVPESQLRGFYQQLDYVLVPALIEGGPMSLLEALSLGKPVIAPAGVGMVPEFVGCERVHQYDAGDLLSLERVVRRCYAEKLQGACAVTNRSWDDWAESHHHVFTELLKRRGIPFNSAGPRFRFGLIKDLNLPWGVDLEPLENVVDIAAAHLFYSRVEDAEKVLADVLDQFPCVAPLLQSLRSPDQSPNRVLPQLNGSVADVAPTPPDVVRAQPTRNPRILLIAHVGTLRDRMDKSHFLRYQALARCEGVKIFGPGLPGYSPALSLREVIHATFGEDPDLVIHGGDLYDSGIPLVTGLESSELPTAIELLDTWARPHLTLNFIQSLRFDCALMQEGGKHLEFYRHRCPQTKFFWTPNGVDTAIFRDYGLPKEYDIILYGVTEPVIYPLRTRLTRLLGHQSDLKVKIIQHPGYGPAGKSAITGADLAREINKSWIGIATRSMYDCLLMKYLEIPMSGAAIAGNIPTSGRDLLDSCIIELTDEMSDPQIIGILKEALSDQQRLLKMIKTASQRISRDFSVDVFADRVIQIARDVMKKPINN